MANFHRILERFYFDCWIASLLEACIGPFSCLSGDKDGDVQEYNLETALLWHRDSQSAGKIEKPQRESTIYLTNYKILNEYLEGSISMAALPVF